jgi:SAM-dependent methyltransferase
MKLNLGCGKDFREGWVNADLYASRVDDRFDVRDPFPYEDESFSEIYASGILEQIGPNEEFRNALNECRRVLKTGGRLVVVVPDASYPIAFRDPFDSRRFTRETWNYVLERNFYFENYGSIYGFKPWRSARISTNEKGIMTVELEK